MDLESLQSLSHLGEILATSSALIWAAAFILFRISGRHVHALGLNLFKVILSGILLAAAMGILGDPIFPSFSWKSYGWLLLSGITGIGIADTLLFASLNRLGAGLSAVVNSSYSPFVIFLAFLFIDEHLNGFQLFGVLLIISGVLTISQKKEKFPVSRRDLITGIILGIVSMFFMAIGIVIMKPVLNQSPLLWATLMRTAGGILFLTPVILLHSKRRVILSQTLSIKNWKPMLSGSFLGGFVSLLAWMGGMKYTLASQASALNQLTTVFIFVLGAIFLKERVTKRRVLALFLAFAGAILVTFQF